MISGFPDISSNTILQNCFHPFLSAVLDGFGPATLFPCIPVPSPSVPALAWRRARSISPFQGLRGRGDGGKPRFSIQQPSPCLRKAPGQGVELPVRCRMGGSAELEEKGRGKKLKRQQKSWRQGGERAGSSTAISVLKASSPEVRPGFQQQGMS